MTVEFELISRISRWLRGSRTTQGTERPEAQAAAQPEIQRVQFTVPPIWQKTKLPSILKEISQRSAHLEAPALLEAAEHEIREAKSAHKRRASVSSVKHLYTAQAFRMLANAPDSPELLSNLAWQLSENGDYSTARAIGRYAYELAIGHGSSEGAAAMPAFKLAIYDFYLGNLGESRKWLQLAARQMHDWGDYVAFERKVSFCEEAQAALTSSWQGDEDYGILTKSADLALSQGKIARALLLLRQASQVAQKSRNQQQTYDAQFGIARLLYERVRFFSESSSWYVKAFRTALDMGRFSAAAEALLNGAQAHLETGNRAMTAEIIRRGLQDLGNHVEGLALSRLYVTLAFVLSEQNPTLAGDHLNTAIQHLANEGPEDVLEWALTYGRWFIKTEQENLAIGCLNAGFKIAQTSYYSPRVSSVFRELAHIYFLQEKWTTCLLTLNESRNRSYVQNDAMGICAAMLHAAQVYQSANERGVAAKTITAAMTIARSIDDENVRDQVTALWAELNFEANPLEDRDSGWNAALENILTEPPGSNLFNFSMSMIRGDVRQIETIKDLTPYYDSESFRFPFIIAAYGVALDRSGDQRRARNYLARAYRMHRGLKNYLEAVSTLHEYAVSSARLGLYHTARRAFLVALTLKQRYGSLTNSFADSLLGFVQASIRLGLTKGLDDSLGKLLKEAESGHSMWSGPESYSTTSVQMIAAEGYLLLNDTQEADRLAALVKGSIRESRPEDLNPTSLLHVARFELARKRPEQSLFYARQAMELFEKTRPNVVGPYHRTELQRYEVPAAWAIVEAGYEIGLSEADTSLRTTEFARVRSLLERFGRSRVPTPSGFPADLRKEDDKLRTATDDLLNKLQAAQTPRERDELTAKLADLELFEQSFIKRISDKFRDYAKLRSALPLEPSEIIKKYLSSNDTEVLALFPSERASFVWHLDADGKTKNWYRVPVPLGKINLLARSLELQVSRREWNDAFLDEVTNTLLDNCLRSINPGITLCLVVGGALLQIPLCAARVRDRGYLCERHPIALLPSFSLAAFWESAERATRSAAVFADSLGDLLYARKEADIVARTLKCQQLRGRDVTRESFLTAMSSCDLLHVACHADYNHGDPLSSGIRLRDDQRLTCRDLMAVNSRARFAFLSACETGRLTVRSGDELEGLTSSVMYSGFEAVIGSLWRVPDRETRGLVEVFYHHLRNNEDLARSLQAGQLQVLKNNQTASPYFWGAWQVVGNWKARLN